MVSFEWLQHILCLNPNKFLSSFPYMPHGFVFSVMQWAYWSLVWERSSNYFMKRTFFVTVFIYYHHFYSVSSICLHIHLSSAFVSSWTGRQTRSQACIDTFQAWEAQIFQNWRFGNGHPNSHFFGSFLFLVNLIVFVSLLTLSQLSTLLNQNSYWNQWEFYLSL